MNFPLYIARRTYTDSGDKKKVSKPALYIATAGVAIGLAVMIVSVCVIFGFKHTIRNKVVGLGSHLTVASYNALHGGEQTPIDVTDSMLTVIRKTPGQKHIERYAITQGILKTDSDFIGVVYKGIAADYDTTFIHSSLKSGFIPKFSDKASGNKILVSQIIADKLKIKAGDKVYSYFINGSDIRARRFTVAGIYQTNMSKFDETLCFCDLYTAVKLNGWEESQISGIEISVADYKAIDQASNYLVKNVNRAEDKYGVMYSSETIQEMYPQVFSWLDLLDLNVWIILALMTCVAGITIISGLLIIILERTNMIGILKALGCRNKSVRHVFLWFAAFIIGRGILIGDAIGIGIVLLQQFTGIVKLDASVYYVDYVPVELNLPIILLINISTLLICLLVFIGPSFLVSHITPAKSMKYE